VKFSGGIVGSALSIKDQIAGCAGWSRGVPRHYAYDPAILLLLRSSQEIHCCRVYTQPCPVIQDGNLGLTRKRRELC
jgi:hypothetical protein